MPDDYTIRGAIPIKKRSMAVGELLIYAREHTDAVQNNYFDNDTNILYLDCGGCVTIHFRPQIHKLLDEVGADAYPCVIHDFDGAQGVGLVCIGANDMEKANALSKYLTDEFLEGIGRINGADRERLRLVLALGDSEVQFL